MPLATREALSDDDIRVIERLTKETPAFGIWRQQSTGQDRQDLIDTFSRAYLRGVHGAWQKISKHIRNHYKGDVVMAKLSQANRAVARAARAERKLAKREAKLVKAQAKVELRKAKLEATKKVYEASRAEAEKLGAYAGQQESSS